MHVGSVAEVECRSNARVHPGGSVNRSSRQLPYLIAAVGGGLLFISLFFDWLSGVTVGVPGLRTSTISTSRTGWEIFSGVDIFLAALGIATIVYSAMWLLEMGPSPWLPSRRRPRLPPRQRSLLRHRLPPLGTRPVEQRLRRLPGQLQPRHRRPPSPRPRRPRCRRNRPRPPSPRPRTRGRPQAGTRTRRASRACVTGTGPPGLSTRRPDARDTSIARRGRAPSAPRSPQPPTL